MRLFNLKLFGAVMLLLVLLFANAGFSQNKESFTLQLDSFSAKIKEQTKPQIIDARGAEEFVLNHIEGAVNFNLESPDYKSAAATLDKTKPVFVYSIGAGRSVFLAQDLLKNGFTEVYTLEGGIANWIGNGKPFYSNSKSKLTLAEYNKLIAENNLVLVDFGSQYCPGCKIVKPVLETIITQYGNELKVVEIELEDSPKLIADLKTIRAFPTLILYKNGKVIFKKEGINDLKKEVDVAISSN